MEQQAQKTTGGWWNAVEECIRQVADLRTAVSQNRNDNSRFKTDYYHLNKRQDGFAEKLERMELKLNRVLRKIGKLEGAGQNTKKPVRKAVKRQRTCK